MSEYKKINDIPMFTQTLSNGNEVLLSTFRYRNVEIPVGFEFDGASTPRFFWSIIPPFMGTKRAACVHDYLCQTARNHEDRKKADKLFKLMLKETGFNPVRVYAGYFGVRIGAIFGVGNHF